MRNPLLYGRSGGAAIGEYGEQRIGTDPLTQSLGALAVGRVAPDTDALMLERVGQALAPDEARATA